DIGSQFGLHLRSNLKVVDLGFRRLVGAAGCEENQQNNRTDALHADLEGVQSTWVRSGNRSTIRVPAHAWCSNAPSSWLVRLPTMPSQSVPARPERNPPKSPIPLPPPASSSNPRSHSWNEILMTPWLFPGNAYLNALVSNSFRISPQGTACSMPSSIGSRSVSIETRSGSSTNACRRRSTSCCAYSEKLILSSRSLA